MVVEQTMDMGVYIICSGEYPSYLNNPILTADLHAHYLGRADP